MCYNVRRFRGVSMKQIFFRLLIGALLFTTSNSAYASNLTGAGATFPFPLYSTWFDVYKQTGTRVHYQPIGSGGGINQIKAQTVDFGASDYPLSDAELA